MEKLKKNKGITLIALVITIIVLLILAGITISALTGDNGLFTRAQRAKDESEISADIETIKIEYSSYNIDQVSKPENKTFLEYLDENGYIVDYENAEKTIGIVILNGRKYEINTEGELIIKYLGKADKTAMLMPRFSKVEAVVEGTTIKVNVELKKSTVEGTKLKYSIQKENETTKIEESNLISDTTYTFENLEIGQTYIITVQAKNEYGTTNRKIKVKTVSLSELTQGKAEFIITPNEKWQEKVNVTIQSSYEDKNTILQYSIGNIKDWTNYTTSGFEVDKNVAVYGRFYNPTTQEIGYTFTINIQIIDDIAPQITITNQEIKSKTIKITVEAKDKELGMPNNISYKYYIGTTKENSKLIETKTENTMTYENLQPNTQYFVKVQTADKVGNIGILEKEITTEMPVLVSKITLDKENETIGSNSTLQINATIEPENADDKSVTWSSSNTTVATVSSSGLVTPKKEGNVIITCTAKDGSGVSAICNLQVMNGSLIYTRADLEAIADNPGGSYVLMNDIDLSGKNWTPIEEFWGTLDGNGYSINNLKIYNTNASGQADHYYGFIREITTKKVTVTIKNLKFKNVSVYSASAYVGCLVGYIGTNDTVNISNVGIESGSVKGQSSVGSLFGTVNTGNGNLNVKIKNCYSHANLNSSNGKYNTGGFIGNTSYTSTYGVYNSYWDGTTNVTMRVGPVKSMYNNDNTDNLTKIKYTIQNCYYNKDKFTITTNTPSTTGLTTEQFANQNNFKGWDFENTWIIKDGRPELRIFLKD